VSSASARLSDRGRRFIPQPLVGAATAALAALALAASWYDPIAAPSSRGGAGDVVLALALAAAIVAAYQFPIHVRLHMKVQLVNLPCYLMAVLLPPPLAATATALGVLGGALSVRKQRDLYPSDIACIVGGQVLIEILAASVGHAPPTALPHVAALIGAGVTLWLGGIVTFPLVLAPALAERPFRVMVFVAREASLTEGTQYLLGLLAALAAEEQVWALALLVVPTALIYNALKSAKEMHDNTRELLESMADAVDLRDAYTGGHSRRVTEYSAAILRELGLQGDEVTLLLSAARVHDIGKIGVPDAVLNKPGPLTAEERAIMQSHAEKGAELLRRYADFTRGVAIVLHHHESWDGTGYPHGLKGTNIPFGARVVAVADSFDAMTSDRPYRRGMPLERAVSILRDGRGRQWDAALVDALLRTVTIEVPTPLKDERPKPYPTPATAAAR